MWCGVVRSGVVWCGVLRSGVAGRPRFESFQMNGHKNVI